MTPLAASRASATYNDALPVLANAAAAASPPISSNETTGLVLQHFRVDANSFVSALRNRVKGGGERQQLEVDLLKASFKQEGIDVSPAFSILYRSETGDLMVRPRPEDRKKVARLLAELQSAK